MTNDPRQLSLIELPTPTIPPSAKGDLDQLEDIYEWTTTPGFSHRLKWLHWLPNHTPLTWGR